MKVYSSDMACAEVIAGGTLVKLGDDPRCRTTSDFNFLEIELGANSEIGIADQIEVLPTSLRGLGCFENFESGSLSSIDSQILDPELLPKPVFRFKKSKEEFSLCVEIEIEVEDEKFNGMRALEYEQWSLLDTDDSNATVVQQVQDLLQKKNQAIQQDNSPHLAIPKLFLSAFSYYTFQLSARNFLGGQGMTQVKVLTLSSVGVDVQILTKPLDKTFYIYNQLFFQGHIS